MIEGIALRRLIAPVIVAFLLALIVRLPASAVLSWALPASVETRGISGTIWNGSIDVVATQGVAVGPVTWQWRASALLSGRIGADVEAGLPGGFFSGAVGVGTSSLVLEDVRLLADLLPLTRRSSMGAAQGTVRVSAARLRLESLWPSDIEGEVRLDNLKYAATGSTALGGYVLQFDGVRSDDPAFPLDGALQSDGSGPFEVRGILAMGPERAYALNATVAPRANAPREVAQALTLLPTNASGQRVLSFEGAL